MPCLKCSGEVIKITNICYDNIEITKVSDYIGGTTNLGFKYDGKTFSIEYCSSCGMVQHTFPLMHDIKLEPVQQVSIRDTVTVVYDLFKEGDYKSGNKKLSLLSRLMPPSEFYELSTLLGNYCNIRQSQPFYMELDNYVNWLISHYK